MDLDQIEKLNDLKQKGLITEEEFQQAKERILGAQTKAHSSTQDNAQIQPHTIM
ncbi:MAG TPA: SHOCT domain-containing protein, partial [Cellvibrio sp.]